MSRTSLAIAGAVALLASAGVAFAQTPGEAAAQAAQPMLLQVNKNGDVLMRGTIDAVSSGSLTVKSWGGQWTVNLAPSADILPSGTALASFKQGDFVGVRGTIDAQSSWTITATTIHDWAARKALNEERKGNVQAVREAVASSPRMLQGSLSNFSATAQTFTLTTEKGTAYAASLASGAKLLTKDWTTLDLAKVSNGDSVRVYGTVASSTVAVSIFRDISVK